MRFYPDGDLIAFVEYESFSGRSTQATMCARAAVGLAETLIHAGAFIEPRRGVDIRISFDESAWRR
jgi:hypothetical protein